LKASFLRQLGELGELGKLGEKNPTIDKGMIKADLV
jgi:hypothetical protein